MCCLISKQLGLFKTDLFYFSFDSIVVKIIFNLFRSIPPPQHSVCVRPARSAQLERTYILWMSSSVSASSTQGLRLLGRHWGRAVRPLHLWLRVWDLPVSSCRCVSEVSLSGLLCLLRLAFASCRVSLRGTDAQQHSAFTSTLPDFDTAQWSCEDCPCALRFPILYFQFTFLPRCMSQRQHRIQPCRLSFLV